MKQKIIFILGPTASGKTEVAIELAKRLNGEIISCDSMQVYENMDIITQGVIDPAIGHHLVKVISPEEEFNAVKFIEMATRAICSILKKGKVPIFVGGTGLYVKRLLDGIFSAPEKDVKLRRALEELAKEKGNVYLHNELKKVDPETAAVLHFNDVRRIVRALEIFKLTGGELTDKKNDSRGIFNKYDCRMFGLSLPRDVLYARIEARVEAMFDEGLVEEVKALKKRALSLTASKALGVKEAEAYLDGKMNLEETKKELKKNTRHYAKRQLTWFRSDGRIEWIDANRDIKKIVNEILIKQS
ncbi:MAG: tRNA (adenosine(37)-N6)-dimethylallyltransferase MiaA [Candidatus Omnitrophica bacterium]|nr:tRNA (adenosine(37)-N6)-dimethylallyltransferase MiaA [Candidatus Omnitrophota bacterium]